MIDLNIKYFRRMLGMTQEQLAEQLCVSRQTVAKWENGEAAPNIGDCVKMSEIFQVSLDNLVRDVPEEEIPLIEPRGKHFFGVEVVGDNGQIVIPESARKVFKISPGDKLLVLGDESQGLAMVKTDAYESFAGHILAALNQKGEI